MVEYTRFSWRIFSVCAAIQSLMMYSIWFRLRSLVLLFSLLGHYVTAFSLAEQMNFSLALSARAASQEKAERRPKGLHHSRSGSSGSPSTSCRDSLPAHGDRVSGKGAGGAAEESGLDSAPYKAATDTKPCLKKLSERPTTSNSVLDLSSGRTSLRPTQYKLEEALPTPCSAPPLRRSSHSLIRPTHSSSAPREASISPVPPEKPTTGSVNETLVHRLISNHKHKDPIHSVRPPQCPVKNNFAHRGGNIVILIFLQHTSFLLCFCL